MKTEQAYQAYQVQAANNANYQSTILWILFTIFIIVPAIVGIAILFIAIVGSRKCPKCGSRKKVSATKEVTKSKGEVISHKVMLCESCGTEL